MKIERILKREKARSSNQAIKGKEERETSKEEKRRQ